MAQKNPPGSPYSGGVSDATDTADPGADTPVGPRRLHAFRDDALGYDDATALAERVRRREVSPSELLEAAINREYVKEGKIM